MAYLLHRVLGRFSDPQLRAENAELKREVALLEGRLRVYRTILRRKLNEIQKLRSQIQ